MASMFNSKNAQIDLAKAAIFGVTFVAILGFMYFNLSNGNYNGIGSATQIGSSGTCASPVLIGTDSTLPFSVFWNTSGLSDGVYKLTAKAVDTSNNDATSGEVSVSVNNVAARAAPKENALTKFKADKSLKNEKIVDLSPKVNNPSERIAKEFVENDSVPVVASFQQDGDQIEFLASDRSAVDWLGISVSMSGDRIITGAKFDDDLGAASGSAYIFHRNVPNWVEYKIIASDGAQQDEFGSSVSIDGDIAVVGAPKDNINSIGDVGSAYVFRWNASNWAEEQKLVISDYEYLDLCGNAVSVSGDTIIMGCFNADNPGFLGGNGAAYVFRFNGSMWVQEAKLVAPDAAATDRFGISVGVFGNFAVVGADWDDDGGNASGSAYVFRRTGSVWDTGIKLPRSDPAAADFFGSSVAINGNLILVGAYQDDDNGTNFGSVYVYRWNGSNWVLETKLYGSDSQTNEAFGYAISAGNDLAAVGAHNFGRSDTGSIDGYGKTYIYRKNGANWIQEQTRVAIDPSRSDYFGKSVSVFGNQLLVGAPQHDHGLGDVGAAFFFDLSVPSANMAPVVFTGSDQTINFGSTANFNSSNAYVFDDGLPSGNVTTLWTKESGPGNVTFNNPNVIHTWANFSLPGVYVLRLTADDGELIGFDDVQVTVNSPPDSTPPSVSITSPANNSTVSATVVINASATDNIGITKVEFYQDTILIGTDTDFPYSAIWNTTTTTNGSHVLTAKAFDTASPPNITISAQINVTVSNSDDSTPPTVSITSPTSGSILSSIVSFSANAGDNVGISKVEFYHGTTLIGTDITLPYSVSWNTVGLANGSYSLTAKAFDTAPTPNTATSVPVNVTVDNQAPSVNITSPANNAEVFGTINISANATDNVGISRVEFYRATTLIGSDITAPYSINWNTTTVSDGPYVLIAKAFDTATPANTTTSAPVNLTVANIDSVPPSVAITSPINGSSVSGTVTVAADASDNRGIQRVEFYQCQDSSFCLFDWDCDDGLFCNGVETCVSNICNVGSAACSVNQSCDEPTESCIDQECVLSNPLWLNSTGELTSSTIEGSQMQLNVNVSNCVGKTIRYDIYEYSSSSSVFDTFIVGLDAVAGPTTATAPWIALWLCDEPINGMCTGDPPEYYFIATVVNETQTTTSTNLTVERTSAICGDGIKRGTEQCDDGNESNNDTCTNSCQFNICGDGLVFTGIEACDDGNLQDNDYCSSDCTCGDSDGGIKYSQKGTVTKIILAYNPPLTYTDYCTNSPATGHLNEYYCQNNQSTSTTYHCPYGCTSGKCNPGGPKINPGGGPQEIE